MSCFHPLHTHLKPPERLNNPFGYVPSPLCQLAAGETQRFILSQDSWQEELHQGKMFGVLVVENHEGVLGFLAAYSGLLANRNDWEWFVPPVFDAQQPDGHFKKEEAVISQINTRLNLLPQSSEWQQAQRKLEEMRQTQAAELSAYKQRMAEAKAKRDLVRKAREKGPTLPSEEELTKESQKMKADLRRLKKTTCRSTGGTRGHLEKYAGRSRCPQARATTTVRSLATMALLPFCSTQCQGRKTESARHLCPYADTHSPIRSR